MDATTQKKIEESFRIQREELTKLKQDLPEYGDYDWLWAQLNRDEAYYLKLKEQESAEEKT
jgi:hypothetical protein